LIILSTLIVCRNTWSGAVRHHIANLLSMFRPNPDKPELNIDPPEAERFIDKNLFQAAFKI